MIPGFSRPMTVSQYDPRRVEQLFELPDRGERHPELRVFGMGEALGHHAEHFVRDAVEHDRPADNGRVRAEPARPQPVRENHDALPAGLPVGRSEAPASRGRHAERVEEVGCYSAAADLRRVAAARQRHARARVRRHPLERRARPPPVLEVRIRGDVLVEPLTRVVGPDHHQPVGLRVGKRPQQHGVDDGEDRRVRSDAERQRHRRDRIEERLFRDAPEGVDQIVQHDGPRIYSAQRREPFHVQRATGRNIADNSSSTS